MRSAAAAATECCACYAAFPSSGELRQTEPDRAFKSRGSGTLVSPIVPPGLGASPPPGRTDGHVSRPTLFLLDGAGSHAIGTRPVPRDLSRLPHRTGTGSAISSLATASRWWAVSTLRSGRAISPGRARPPDGNTAQLPWPQSARGSVESHAVRRELHHSRPAHQPGTSPKSPTCPERCASGPIKLEEKHLEIPATGTCAFCNLTERSHQAAVWRCS